MKIRLFGISVLARNLTWDQVQEAIEKAKKSEAGKHFRFYEGADQEAASLVARWSLIAMPKIYYETTFEGKDKSGWYITIQDYVYPPGTAEMPQSSE